MYRDVRLFAEESGTGFIYKLFSLHQLVELAVCPAHNELFDPIRLLFDWIDLWLIYQLFCANFWMKYNASLCGYSSLIVGILEL